MLAANKYMQCFTAWQEQNEDVTKIANKSIYECFFTRVVVRKYYQCHLQQIWFYWRHMQKYYQDFYPSSEPHL